jgi:hypothetical protein
MLILNKRITSATLIVDRDDRFEMLHTVYQEYYPLHPILLGLQSKEIQSNTIESKLEIGYQNTTLAVGGTIHPAKRHIRRPVFLQLSIAFLYIEIFEHCFSVLAPPFYFPRASSIPFPFSTLSLTLFFSSIPLLPFFRFHPLDECCSNARPIDSITANWTL